jgi:uncharacterized membrane protein
VSLSVIWPKSPRPWLVLTALLLLYFSWYLGSFDHTSTSDDIYYIFLEGQRLAAGENPYARVLGSDMLRNDKYATYLPGAYLAGAGLHLAGFETFAEWLRVWRWLLLVVMLATVGVFFVLLGAGQRWLALFFAAFWLFNRWTLEVVEIAHIDPLALLFLILSLALLPRRPRVAALLLGISLAVKHIGILLVPLYLLYAWQASGDWRHVLRQGLWLGVIPLVLALPFLFWDAEALIRSLLFSVTRLSDHSVGVASLDEVIGLVGVAARLPMLVLIAAVYLLASSGAVNRWTAAFLVFAVFTGYNSVLYPQYMIWPLTLLPLIWAKADGEPEPRVNSPVT